MQYDQQALIGLIREKALRFGDFTLASGKRASYYLDCRQVTLDAAGILLVAAGMLDRLRSAMPDVIGGLAIGADPITAGILTLAGIERLPLRGIIVRKEAKLHGAGGSRIAGALRPGERVMLIEDVVTTGGSALEASDQIEAAGAHVVGALALVDRLEGGREALAEREIPLNPLLTVRDLGIEPAESSNG